MQNKFYYKLGALPSSPLALFFLTHPEASLKKFSGAFFFPGDMTINVPRRCIPGQRIGLQPGDWILDTEMRFVKLSNRGDELKQIERVWSYRDRTEAKRRRIPAIKQIRVFF